MSVPGELKIAQILAGHLSKCAVALRERKKKVSEPLGYSIPSMVA